MIEAMNTDCALCADGGKLEGGERCIGCGRVGTELSPEMKRAIEETKRAIREAFSDNPIEQAALDTEVARLKAKVEAWEIIEALTATEGNSVTILSENPEGNGPDNHAIDVCGDVTDWKERRFHGPTVLDALKQAHRYLQEFTDA